MAGTGATPAEAAVPLKKKKTGDTTAEITATGTLTETSTSPGGVEAEIEVDESLRDDDSGFGGDNSLYTSELPPDVTDYPVEHGRRYHAFRSGRYTRPNDEQEMERLLIIHKIITRTLGGLFLSPIDQDKTKRILDIGTGTGIWAIEVGDLLPDATVIGNDLSANMPDFVPPNVKFEVDDVESEWLHEEKFSFIFSRYMAASIFDWPKLVRTIYDNLEPGGWCEFQDFDLRYYSDDGSLRPEDPLRFWITTIIDAAQQLGRDCNPGAKLETWAAEAGFRNVVHRRHKLPIGTWARDPALKEIGSYNYMQVNQGLEGLSLRLFTTVLQWKREQILALLARVRQDLRNPRIHAMLDLHVIYAQKTG